jgi:hypothetical protein
MKTSARVILATTILSGITTTAFAAAGGREDHSTLVVWAFLGFCALIVLVQVLPALRNARLVARKEQQEREQENAVQVPARE